MHNAPMTGARLVAVFLAGFMLFNYPLTSLVNGDSFWLGVPAPVAYLFLVWAGLIALMAWIIEGPRES